MHGVTATRAPMARGVGRSSNFIAMHRSIPDQ
jgi:hypothetical protein